MAARAWRSGSADVGGPPNAAGSQTSRSSGAMLKSPHTATGGPAPVSSRKDAQPASQVSLARTARCPPPSVRDIDVWTRTPHRSAATSRAPGVHLGRRNPSRLVEADPAGDGHSVPAPFAVVGRSRSPGRRRPCPGNVVGLFRLLEAHDIGLGYSIHSETRDIRAVERVHVPGGDAQLARSSYSSRQLSTKTNKRSTSQAISPADVGPARVRSGPSRSRPRVTSSSRVRRAPPDDGSGPVDAPEQRQLAA